MWLNRYGWPFGLFLAAAFFANNVDSQEPPDATRPDLRITASPRTTVLTEPLRHDGYVDYIAAVNRIASQGVTPENNAAVPFIRALGSVCVGDMDPDRFYPLLGIEPLPEEGEYFVPLDRYAATRSADEGFEDQIRRELDNAVERPWSEQEFPKIARWLRLNQEPLELFCCGCRRPRYYAPMLGGADEGDAALLTDVRLSTLEAVRNVARSLTARAMLRLREGDIGEARSDLLTCHRLARLVGQDPTLIGIVVSVSIEDLACRGDAHLIASETMTAKLARSAVADLQALAPLPRLRPRIEQAERFATLDGMTAVASRRVELGQVFGASGGPEFDVLVNVVNTLTDWDLVLRHVNGWYDRAAAALERPTYAERAAAFEQLEDDLREAGQDLVSPRRQFETLLTGQASVSQRVGDLFACLSLPVTSVGHVAEHRGIAFARLDLLGYALAAHRAEHGGYPEQLGRLVPDYLAELPADPFTGRPFFYKPEKSGFLLYSAGPNMEDNLGRNWGLEESESAPDTIHYEWDDLRLRVPPG